LDESDDEWDEHVLEEYGPGWRNTLWREEEALDAGLDMADLVHHAFHHYDENVVFNGRDFMPRNEGHPAPAHGQGRDGAPAASPPHDPPEHPASPVPHHVEFEGNEEPDGRRSAEDTPWQPFDGDPEEAALENDDLNFPPEDALSHESLHECSRVCLYTGSKLSCLSATLLILNSCHTHGCTTTFIDELFRLLSKSVLPDVNSLPISEYQASKKLRELGLSYNSIHVYANLCMLFRGEYEHLTHCLKCHSPRYRRAGKSWVPVKVLQHFPLLPRIRRMFSTPLQASYMSWHHHYHSTDSMVRFVADSKQWKQIDADWPDFAEEPRNIRFGIATNGFNPFSIKRSTWSTWPVMLLNYNVPPWMTTKKHFILLSLIIPGPKSVTGEHFDVFLQPLVEELHYGWSIGVRVADASNYLGKMLFNCQFMAI
jgi:hypothetical protein